MSKTTEATPATTAVVVLMSEAEAEQCVADIRGHVMSARQRLLELHEREGWRVLKDAKGRRYADLETCVRDRLGKQWGERHVQRQLAAAKLERECPDMTGRSLSHIAEWALRPLTGIASPADRQAAVAELAADPDPTIARAEEITARYLNSLPPEEAAKVVEREAAKSRRSARRVQVGAHRVHAEKAIDLCDELDRLAHQLRKVAVQAGNHVPKAVACKGVAARAIKAAGAARHHLGTIVEAIDRVLDSDELGQAEAA